MNDVAVFPLTDVNEAPAERLSYPTVAVRVEAPCPGSFENAVVLLKGQQVLDGLIKPRNVGSCKIHILCFDGTGTYIGAYHLERGEEDDFLKFPSNTEVVKMGCLKGCTGTAVLEYRTPNIS